MTSMQGAVKGLPNSAPSSAQVAKLLHADKVKTPADRTASRLLANIKTGPGKEAEGRRKRQLDHDGTV